MSLITYFSPQPLKNALPQGFPSPLNKTPHPLACQACELLQMRLSQAVNIGHDFNAPDGGKMLGVLVVRDKDNRIGFLAAFSGMLAGCWEQPGFVPPVFDQGTRDAFLLAGERELANYAERIAALCCGAERRKLKIEVAQLSKEKERELQALLACNKARKAQRHARRVMLEKINDEIVAVQLTNLSFESQQDKRKLKAWRFQWQSKLAPVERKLAMIAQEVETLKKARAELSNRLHRQVLEGYRLKNKLGEQYTLTHFFNGKQPPSGTGDCAAPKLIHYATENNLVPLALAEFWWGASPKDTIRQHGYYYPACRGKCQPILPFMLKGYTVIPRQVPGDHFNDKAAPSVIYEDEDLVVVNKPCGLLSVPGKEVQDSVLVRLQKRYPQATGPLMVHRLDLATSGLLLMAKNIVSYKALQKQFFERTIEKRYVAVLSTALAKINQGVITLPLRVDLDDRPRQMVCFDYGKLAITRWQVIARDKDTTRVYLYPLTGRTHQLRLHAAHPDGLNAPIIGDELYGEKAERLLLHAERLCFTQPKRGERINVIAEVPF